MIARVFFARVGVRGCITGRSPRAFFLGTKREVALKPFDERLYALKLHAALVPRMHRDTAERRRKVLSRQREIGQAKAGALHKIADSDIGVIRDYILEVDTVCRQTWQSDGNAITPEFIRNVLVHRVFSFIATREGDSGENLKLFAGRTNTHTHLSAALGHLVRGVNQLKGEIANRYEIEATELSKKESQARKVTQAPPPPREVGGFGITHTSAKPTQIPPDFPVFFPKELKARTAVILAEAVRKFQYQTQTLELCKHIISEMIPLFCEAVTDGTMKASMALEEGLGGMGDLLRSLVVYNDDGPHTGWGLSNEAYRLRQEARKSDEWLSLAKAIVEAEQRGKSPVLEQNKPHEPADAQRVKDSSAANLAQGVEGRPKDGATAIGRNITMLRMECGWSLDHLASQTGIDKKSILSHVNKGVRPIPRILKEYADAFSKKLGRKITAPDLEK
jgi:hypothetical protein